jgi:hypothetical protein
VHGELDPERHAIIAKPAPDILQPLFVALGGALIETREGADDASLARRNHEIGVGHEKKRRRHHRKPQAALELCWNHSERLSYARQRPSWDERPPAVEEPTYQVYKGIVLPSIDPALKY